MSGLPFWGCSWCFPPRAARVPSREQAVGGESARWPSCPLRGPRALADAWKLKRTSGGPRRRGGAGTHEGRSGRSQGAGPCPSRCHWLRRPERREEEARYWSGAPANPEVPGDQAGAVGAEPRSGAGGERDGQRDSAADPRGPAGPKPPSLRATARDSCAAPRRARERARSISRAALPPHLEPDQERGSPVRVNDPSSASSRATMTHFNKGPSYGLSAEVKNKVRRVGGTGVPCARGCGALARALATLRAARPGLLASPRGDIEAACIVAVCSRRVPGPGSAPSRCPGFVPPPGVPQRPPPGRRALGGCRARPSGKGALCMVFRPLGDQGPREQGPSPGQAAFGPRVPSPIGCAGCVAKPGPHCSSAPPGDRD